VRAVHRAEGLLAGYTPTGDAVITCPAARNTEQSYRRAKKLMRGVLLTLLAERSAELLASGPE
jgi:hypothetical protein